MIARLGDILKHLVKPYCYIYARSKENEITRLLTPTEKVACAIYCNEGYKNINRFFRGEPLIHAANNLINENQEQKQLACFLLGCILNNAASKLNYLLHQLSTKQLLDKLECHYHICMVDYVSDEAGFQALLKKTIQDKMLSQAQLESIKFEQLKYLYPSATLLDRREELTEEEIKRRVANVWAFPALTSFCADKRGTLFYMAQR